ncbi:MAG: glycosyltransferase family 39 protein [Patescibacteria group bacterium]|nr:glycosyltransferase family 39 protein [Patescibacteria group bacterium]MCL5431536.1 glycosyltransferase family 39 protein [Patescibacteria group bacterium]
MSSIAKLFGNKKLWLLLILILAAFLRFYKLPDYLQFLGDEGRDVLVVERMIVDHQWTLLGPTASVGGFYTGPIYYYFMLPFLWIFNLSPVGPAVMAAIFGLATVVLVYLAGRKFFGEKAGLIAAFLVAVSPRMVDISRFSWNPNPVPFFALLTAFLLYQRKSRFTFLAGLSLGVLVQLHYMDLIFLPIIGLSLLLLFPWREWLVQIVLLAAGTMLGDSMFLLFELRHGFPNTRSVWQFINRHGATVSPRSDNFLWLFNDIARQLYEIVLGFRGDILNLFYYSSLAAFVGWATVKFRQEKPKVIVLGSWLLIGVLGVGSYRGTLYEHYFNILYPLPFLFLGLGGSWLLSKKYLWVIFVIALAGLIYLQQPKMFFYQPPNNLLTQTQDIDKIVLAEADGKLFNFALIAPGNSDHAYLYFLEIWHQSPVTILNSDLDPQRKTVTDQLIVVCEQKDCAPLGNPAWEIAGFGRGEIVDKLIGPAGIMIYKLIHYTGK